MQFRTTRRAANALPSALQRSNLFFRRNAFCIRDSQVACFPRCRTTVGSYFQRLYSTFDPTSCELGIKKLDDAESSIKDPDVERFPLEPFKRRETDLERKAKRWLLANRPAPYITLYEMILRCAPDTAIMYPPPPRIEDKLRHGPINLTGPLPVAADTRHSFILAKHPTIGSVIAKTMPWVVRMNEMQRKQFEASETLDLDPVQVRKLDPRLLYNDSEMKLIKQKGLAIEDLEIFARILLEMNTEEAIAQLGRHVFGQSTEEASMHARHAPISVITMLLRRHGLGSRGLQILLTCSWHTLRFTKQESDRDGLILRLFKRLVERAMHVWPDSLPNIASLLINFMEPLFPDGQPLFRPGQVRRRHLTEAFNSAIEYLRHSYGPSPYRSCINQEKAQFMILSHMVLYDPPLPVDGEAFKALIRVQLKRDQTPQEQEWAILQSRAWPPYPKPQTAMDEDKGFQFGSSRAMRTIQHMRQAGYSNEAWSQVAGIYAGWDVDKTPTIQTRIAYLSQKIETMDVKNELAIWAARITATRDVREAWSVFLAFESTMLPVSPLIFYAMAKKLVEERRRLEGDSSRPEEANISPGTAKEVIAPATSPTQKVFIAGEPPSFMDFVVNRIFESGIEVKPWLTGYLISVSPTVQAGLEIWAHVKQTSHTDDIFNTALSEVGPGKPMTIAEFRGFITLLCRHHSYSSWPRLKLPLQTQQDMPAMQWMPEYGVERAAFLLLLQRSRQPSMYLTVLKGMIRSLHALEPLTRVKQAHRLWDIVQRLLESMRRIQIPPEHEFFSTLCHFAEVCGRISPSLRTRKSGASWNLRNAFRDLVKSSLDTSVLNSATAGTKAENWIPRTVGTPHPILCQHYLRALALFNDWEGIYSFARWLAANEADMVASLEQVKRASQRWTVVITAFRVALESPDIMFPQMPAGSLSKAPEELVQLVKETLKSMTELGGWASDLQVQDYGQHVVTNVALFRNQLLLRKGLKDAR